MVAGVTQSSRGFVIKEFGLYPSKVQDQTVALHSIPSLGPVVSWLVLAVPLEINL